MTSDLLSAVQNTKDITVRGGHFEDAEERLKADLCIVVDDPESFYFSKQTPLWHRFNVMFTHTGSETDKGRLYFTEWETGAE